jgi:hypothetical protein
MHGFRTVAPTVMKPGENKENKHQPDVSGETGLFDLRFH